MDNMYLENNNDQGVGKGGININNDFDLYDNNSINSFLEGSGYKISYGSLLNLNEKRLFILNHDSIIMSISKKKDNKKDNENVFGNKDESEETILNLKIVGDTKENKVNPRKDFGSDEEFENSFLYYLEMIKIEKGEVLEMRKITPIFKKDTILKYLDKYIKMIKDKQ